MRIGLEVKDKSIARGLGIDGDPLRDILATTRKYRRSAMTASGRGDPKAPPLTPAYGLSRARSYLRAAVWNNGVTFWYRFDRKLGLYFGAILRYQAAQGRNILGFSADDLDEIYRRAHQWWAVNRARLARLGAARAGLHPNAASPLMIGTNPPKRMPFQAPTPPIIPAAKPKPIPVNRNPFRVNIPVAPAPVARVNPPLPKPLDMQTMRASDRKLVERSQAGGFFSGFRRVAATVESTNLITAALAKIKKAKKK